MSFLASLLFKMTRKSTLPSRFPSAYNWLNLCPDLGIRSTLNNNYIKKKGSILPYSRVTLPSFF